MDGAEVDEGDKDSYCVEVRVAGGMGPSEAKLGCLGCRRCGGCCEYCA